MLDIYGVACDVHPVRTFTNGSQYGVGYDLTNPDTFFVYDRENRTALWHKHCGPYSDFDQAKQWILNISEKP